MIVPATKPPMEESVDCGYIGKIPVRNLWLLMLYASDLYRAIGQGKVAVEENPDDIPDLVAEILVRAVERRLMRNLSFGYQSRSANLSRVRGRIDLLKTERHQLLSRGMVACRFDELTVNTPRNRFVRAALERISQIVKRDDIAHRCRKTANTLQRMGVVGEKPTRSEVSVNRFGRHDAEDQPMMMAARLAFDLALPTEKRGAEHLPLPEREKQWIYRLYEKAVGGFYDVTLSGKGWRVLTGKMLNWQIEKKTDGIDNILPSMRTDIILDHAASQSRIVIDTKFNEIVTSGWHRKETLRSGYVYQIYAYLRSQVDNGDSFADKASGLLLHPSVGDMVNESVTIQGHKIRFATVDLSTSANEIRHQLLNVIGLFGREIRA